MCVSCEVGNYGVFLVYLGGGIEIRVEGRLKWNKLLNFQRCKVCNFMICYDFDYIRDWRYIK